MFNCKNCNDVVGGCPDCVTDWRTGKPSAALTGSDNGSEPVEAMVDMAKICTGPLPTTYSEMNEMLWAAFWDGFAYCKIRPDAKRQCSG